MRVESRADVALPEIAAPAVVIPADHRDRHSTAKPGQRGGHPEAAPRDDPAVGEPEVEEVAIDEQAVAQSGNRLEECEQRLLDGRRRHAEVGVGDDDESMAQHGAKDGPPGRPGNGRGLSRCRSPNVYKPERPS